MVRNHKNRDSLGKFAIAATLIFLLSIALVLCIGCGKKKAEIEKISLRLSWIVDASAAGYFTAVDKGYYADESLEVDIRPGGIDFPPVKMVASGGDDFGSESGAETIILGRSQDIPVKAIGVIQPGGAPAIITLDRTGIKTPKDLAGKKIAIAYGKPAEYVYRALLKKEGVDTSSIEESVFKFDITPVLRGEIDAFTGFKTNQPFLIKSKGYTPVVIDPDEYGVRTYGLTLFTTDSMIQGKPKLVERFLRATLRGWEYAINHPEESIDILLKFAESLQYDKPIEIEKIKAIAVTAKPKPGMVFGEMDEAVWREMHQRLLDYEIVKTPVDVEGVFTNRFVKEIPK